MSTRRPPRATVTRSGLVATVATVVTVLTVPVATWYLVGDLSDVPAGARPTYLVDPPAVSDGVARVVGLVSLVLAATGLVTAIRWERGRRRPGSPRVVALALLVPAGLIAGYAARAITSGAIGVNFRAVLAQGLLLPISALLVLCALVYGVRRHRDR